MIGAHTKWNNNGTVGISLIGNFQEDYPSSKMIEALTELSTALAAYYGIDPLSDIIVHKETSVDPYVEDVHTSGIFGHRDAGTTSCPGEHVYSLLPKLRSDVATRLLSRDLSIDVDKVQAYLPVQWLWGDRTGTQTLTIDADEATLRGSVSCEWAESDIVVPLDVVDCSVDDTTLSLDVRVHDDFVAGPYPLLVNDGTHQEMWYIKTVWNTALDDLLTLRRKPLVSQLPSDPTPMQKITDHLSVDDARERAE
ncbi:MAG: N-acetylmuramoyl-L-alanine amidase [Candidatus Peribacteria bacterium]|nr:MAG: N-acetylmuramoyl-L-alanine amidase [Candidatus Peribacteria bacterium]